MVKSTFCYLLICFFCLAGICARGQQLTFSPNCVEAYQSFMALRMDEGKRWLAKETSSNPKNMMPFILINYEDLVMLTLNENPAEYKLRKPQMERRLKLLEQSDQQSPNYLLMKGLLYFQWSLVQIKYAEYWNAVWDFRKSYLLFKENQKKFPSLTYNQVFIGLQEAVISTIPKGYKWATSILGLKGDMKQGIKRLRQYCVSNEVMFKEESQLYYIYLKNYLENDVEGASALIKTYKLDTKNNLLFTFMAANLSLNNKNAALAENILNNRNKVDSYMSFPMLDYELGDAKMKRLDYSAVTYFKRFVNTYKGNFYIKDAYLSLAYCAYLQGNMADAANYKQFVITKGKAESDADKQALKAAKKATFPHKEILKARLLNDGGYHQEALKLLLQITSTSLTGSDKLEYMYRIGRVYDDLEQDENALNYYRFTLNEGRTSTEYFAARAALQTGYIYEKRGEYAKALQFFQTVLDLDDHEYKNSLDQRAKSGINRIKGL